MSDIKKLMQDNKEDILEMLSSLDYPYSNTTKFIPVLVNDCKVEYHLESKCFRIGYDLDEETINIIKKAAILKYGEESLKKLRPNPKAVDVIGMHSVDDFKEFLEFVEGIEGLNINIGETHRFTGGNTRGKIQKNNEGIFFKLAEFYKFALDRGMPQIVSRGGDIMDDIDPIILLGESTKRTEENTYREHVVPCKYLGDEAIEMFKSGSSITEVALMLKQYLIIILISNEEQKKLDSIPGLKTGMPENWKLGDNPFERLYKAGIKLK